MDLGEAHLVDMRNGYNLSWKPHKIDDLGNIYVGEMILKWILKDCAWFKVLYRVFSCENDDG
jgi:hypothetical protein